MPSAFGLSAPDEAPLFGRNAEVTIDTLKLVGFDVRFTVVKTLKPLPNTCKLQIFNLNEDHRAQLEQLQPTQGTLKTSKVTKSGGGGKTSLLATTGIPVKIEAGYGKNLSQIWLGDLRTINSIRDGADWVTTLECGDAEKAYQNARIHVSYGAKTPIETALRAMIRALGVGEGNVAKIVASLNMNGTAIYPHGAVIAGSVAQQLTDFARSADLEWSVVDGSIQFLNRGKALAAKAIQLSSDTGMLGSPTVDADGLATFKMLLIPDVRPGSLIVADAERIKGNYRVEKATWNADTAGGEWSIVAVCSRY